MGGGCLYGQSLADRSTKLHATWKGGGDLGKGSSQCPIHPKNFKHKEYMLVSHTQSTDLTDLTYFQPHVVFCLATDIRMVIQHFAPRQQTVHCSLEGVRAATHRPLVQQLQLGLWRRRKSAQNTNMNYQKGHHLKYKIMLLKITMPMPW